MCKGGRLKPGQVLAGKYQIEHKLAQGGGGVVYAARQLGIDRPTVVKTLLPSAALDDDAVYRFEREARVASQLRHPNAVTILDFGHEGDLVFMVMERLEGRTIREVIQQDGAMSPARVQRILRATLECVGAGHALGIVHRDLKPANLFLCQYHGTDDFVKVIDFGIAKLMDSVDVRSEHTISQPGGLLGTPGYLAPEQLRGHPAGVQADLYALGVIGHEMLTGRKAFAGATPLEKLTKQALGELVAPPPEVAASPVYRVIEGLLEPRQSDRFQDADAALTALADLPRLREEGLVSDTPVGVTESPPASPPSATREPPEDFFEYASDVMSAGDRQPGTWRLWPLLVAVAVGLSIVAVVVGSAGWLTSGDTPRTEDAPRAAVEPDASTRDAAEDTSKIEATVRLSMVSVPAGAKVVGPDGERLGKTPVDLERPRSDTPLQVTLRRWGYLPLAVSIDQTHSAHHVYRLERRTQSQSRRPKGAESPPEDAITPTTPTPAPPAKAKPEIDLQPWKKNKIRLGP